ncbi:MAG: TonB-dependent receptor [Opitutaceae bacterium]|nr:TonB-dependent receptor [Opitutaceae bacterium]
MSLSRQSSFYLLGAALAAAQALPPTHDHRHDEPVALENLVVTATPYGRNQADLAQPTSVLAGRELNLRQAPTLGELLAGQPGVSSTYFGPGASRPVIRGLGGDRLRVLENGLGAIDASATSPDHAVSLDPLLIERVEVVRGPSALLYGGNAVGGVVNVITHRIHSALPDRPFQARAEVRTGSADDSLTSGVVLDGAAGRIAWHVDGYVRDTGDVAIPGFAESARRRAAETAEAAEHGEEAPAEIAGHIPNTALRNDGGAFGLSFIGERGFVGLAYSGHNSRYGVPAGAHEHADEGEPAESDHGDEGVRIDLRQRRLDLEGAITESFGPFSGARFKLGTARYRHAELEGDAIGTVFHNRGYDGRLELMHGTAGGLAGAFGWQGGRSDFDAAGDEAFVPPSRTDTQALFLLEETTIGTGTWQFGARYELQEIERRDVSGVGRDDGQVNLSLGYLHRLGDAWTLGASLARTERAPNAQELYADGPHVATNAYEIGDPTLGTEASVAFDVTLRRRTGLVTGALTLFTNHFDGFIFERPTGERAEEGAAGWEIHGDADDDHGIAVYRFVQRDARFVGAEAEAIVHLHEGGDGQLDLIFGADLVRGRNRTDGADLPRITPMRVKTGVAWRRGALALGAEVQFVARQKRTAPGETPTAAYDLISAYANYRLTSGPLNWDLFIRGANLGDREARLHTSFLKDVAPLPGRDVTVGARLTF